MTLVVHHNLCDMGNVPDNHHDQYNLNDLDTVPDIIESRCSGAEKCKEDYIIIPNVIPTVHTASYDRYGLKLIQTLLMSTLDSVVSTSPLRAGQIPMSPLWLVTSLSRWVMSTDHQKLMLHLHILLKVSHVTNIASVGAPAGVVVEDGFQLNYKQLAGNC